MGEGVERNGVGLLVDTETKDGIVQASRESDRVTWLRIEDNEELAGVLYTFVSQVGRDAEENETFWRLLGDVIMRTPEAEYG